MSFRAPAGGRAREIPYFMNIRQKYFADKAFYRRILTVMLPIMVQNAITNFVGLLDNIMVGRLGTLEMSGVAIINTLVSIYNGCIFGAVSGVGIFTVEYHGTGNEEGIRNSFRFKILFVAALAVLTELAFLLGGDFLIGLYLKGKGDPADAVQILGFGKEYLRIVMIGLVPYAFTQCFTSTLRECGKAVPPMITGLIAMGVKVILNILLIFGNLGFPRLGVTGAAIAVVISRFVELAAISLWTKRHLGAVPFLRGVFRSLRVPGSLQFEMIRRAAPLMVNETLWTGGVAFMAQSYTTRELTAVAAVSISSTFYSLLSVTFIAAGIAVGILIGRQLGIRAFDRAKEEARKMIVFTALIGTAVAFVFVGIAFAAPSLYNVTPEVRRMARDMLLITALYMPANSALICSYYVVRSGGKTVLTMFLDSGLMWLFQCLPAYLLSRFTGIRVIPLYFWVQFGLILKLAVNLYFVRRGDWVQSLVEEKSGG